jgi:3-hydroxyisobutyrate dehydrogenase-like beta-hydroxyacid dehydrogenase
MSEEIRRVGFIGLGRMGTAMARNVLKAGFDLSVYNRTAAKAKPLVDEGAALAGSPREASTGSDVVVTCLMDDRSVLENATGDQGLLAGLPKGAIHAGTTTVSPGCARQLAGLHAAHGSHYVAAPVVGRPDAAEAAQLLTFAAGDAEVIARCEPVLRAYSQAAIRVAAEPAVANSLKIAVNYMGASILELMGQVYAFGERSGIESRFIDLLMKTLFGHPALHAYAERIRTRNFDDVGFALTGGLKDVELMLQASSDTRVALPYASIVRDKLLAAIAHGMGEKDWSASYEITRMNAGLK